MGGEQDGEKKIKDSYQTARRGAAKQSGNKHFYFWGRSHDSTVELLPLVFDKSSFTERL